MTLRIGAAASAEMRDLVSQLNAALIRLENPVAPTRIVSFANVASLPPASLWKDCIARCEDVGGGTQGLIYSDGTNWRRADTNATL